MANTKDMSVASRKFVGFAGGQSKRIGEGRSICQRRPGLVRNCAQGRDDKGGGGAFLGSRRLRGEVEIRDSEFRVRGIPTSQTPGNSPHPLAARAGRGA